MTDVELNPGEQTAEFTLPNGCILCGGEIAFRLTPKGAYSFCAHCRWLSQPEVDMSKGSLKVEYRTFGRA